MDDDSVVLRARTKTSRILVSEAARTRVARNGTAVVVERTLLREPGAVGHELTTEVGPEQGVTIEKVVGIFTSRDDALSEPAYAASRAAVRAPGFANLLDKHVLAWHDLWRRFGITIEEGEERTGRIVNLHVFHLLQTLSPHTAALDVGVPARGLHGEAYRGHVFWDELFVLPVRHSAPAASSPARCCATAIGGCGRHAGRRGRRATRARCSRGRAAATGARRRSSAT